MEDPPKNKGFWGRNLLGPNKLEQMGNWVGLTKVQESSLKRKDTINKGAPNWDINNRGNGKLNLLNRFTKTRNWEKMKSGIIYLPLCQKSLTEVTSWLLIEGGRRKAYEKGYLRHQRSFQNLTLSLEPWIQFMLVLAILRWGLMEVHIKNFL